MPFSDVLFRLDETEDMPEGRVTDFYDHALDQAAAKARRYEVRWRVERTRMVKALQAASRGADDRAEEDFVCEAVRDLRGWARVEALLRLSFEERYRNPEKMLLLAYSASEAADGLKPEEHGGWVLVADFQTRARAELANAYRVNDQHERAEDALAKAGTLLERGTGDLLLLARVVDVQASLRSDQRRLGEALDLLEAAHADVEIVGDRHLSGRTLISRGIATHYDGRPQEAVRLLREGLVRIDRDKDPQLANSASLSVIDALADCAQIPKRASGAAVL